MITGPIRCPPSLKACSGAARTPRQARFPAGERPSPPPLDAPFPPTPRQGSLEEKRRQKLRRNGRGSLREEGCHLRRRGPPFRRPGLPGPRPAAGTDPPLTLRGPSAAGCVRSADFQPQSWHLLPQQMLAWASNPIMSIKRARLPQFLRTPPGDKGHSLWVPCSAALCPQCFLEGRPSSEPSRTGPEAPAPACPPDTPQHRPPSFSGSLELVCPSMLPSSNLSHLSRELIFQEILSLQTNSGIKRDNA